MPEILDPSSLIQRVLATLARPAPKPLYHDFSPHLVPVEPARFVLVLGAGFSAGVVPMAGELMTERIGDHGFPDQDGSSMARPRSASRRDSAAFWREFNTAATRAGRPGVDLDRQGLPSDVAAAYNRLFDHEVAELLFAAPPAPPAPSVRSGPGGRWMQQIARHRQAARAASAAPPAPPSAPESRGRGFVRGLLRHALAPGLEHGDGATGRLRINRAHAALAQLLAAQQTGRLPALQPFCRTLMTTNFDSQLQLALAAERLCPIVSDRPERGFDAAMFEPASGPIHIVHLHGSVLRDNPASSTDELADLARLNAQVLADHLAARDVLVVGHSGWRDAVVVALGLRPSARTLYWCDMAPRPSPRIAAVLSNRQGPAAYVAMDATGADGLMTALQAALLAGHPAP